MFRQLSYSWSDCLVWGPPFELSTVLPSCSAGALASLVGSVRVMTIVADLGSLVTVIDSGGGLAYSLQGMRNSAHTLTDISEGIAADSRAAALGGACQGASGPIFAASVAAPAGSALVEFADLVESISSGTSIAVALLAANIVRVADAIEAGDQAAANQLRQVGLGVDR